MTARRAMRKWLGDTKVVTVEHFLYAIGDYAEIEYAAVLSF
jgi:hypothetical protein